MKALSVFGVKYQQALTVNAKLVFFCFSIGLASVAPTELNGLCGILSRGYALLHHLPMCLVTPMALYIFNLGCPYQI